jgi:hypothetical protein
MVIYDDIQPVRPEHMNEDARCVWKQCESRICGRIFNMITEGMVVQTIRYGDGLEGKPTNPNGPTFKKIYCLQCGKSTEKYQINSVREKMQEDMK